VNGPDYPLKYSETCTPLRLSEACCDSVTLLSLVCCTYIHTWQILKDQHLQRTSIMNTMRRLDKGFWSTLVDIAERLRIAIDERKEG
jgi:hypothetical protein